MDRDDLARRLMGTFLGELDEHVRNFNRDLLALENDPADQHRQLPEILSRLHRTAHSLKGAARSVNVSVVEAACHRLEEILNGRAGAFPSEPALLQLLFSAVDGIAEVGRLLRQEQPVTGSSLAALLPVLEEASSGRPVPETPLPARPLPAATVPHGGGPSSGEEAFTRLAVDKLDALLAGSGELLVARRRMAERQEDVVALLGEAHGAVTEWRRMKKAVPASSVDMGEALQRLERRADGLLAGLRSDQQVLDKAAAPLEQEIHRVRMLPFSQACEGLARGLRDLARACGKEADLVVEGSDVELDRSVLQALRDPLLHLVRNAVDHGVETPADRLARAKPRRARIVVRTALKGTAVEVTIEDDGLGLDVAAVAEHARRRGLSVPEDPADVARLVFLPGFSTVSRVTELSGRGVGLDVVRTSVEGLGGLVDVCSKPGRGTRFTLVVPLTLSTIRALLVSCAGQAFALPITSVAVVVRAAPGELESVEGRPMLITRTGPVPAVSLAEVLGIESSPANPEGTAIAFVILSDGGREVAFAVDELTGDQEVVVKNLGRRFRGARCTTGATILSSGRVALILSPAELVRSAQWRPSGHALPIAVTEERAVGPKRLLVVDDSVTTRAFERSILEAAGYEVAVAVDGAEAWRTLQTQPCDLVVADVDMPEMNGFELTKAIKGSRSLRRLPVVLITARESDRDRELGLQAGADAYLPKSTFDQAALLRTVAQLL